MDCRTLYYENSIPLKKVETLSYGDEFFDIEGNKVRCVGTDCFEMVKASPLVPGEKLADIKDPKVLRLFWTIFKNTQYD
jgi:hypothetical protein